VDKARAVHGETGTAEAREAPAEPPEKAAARRTVSLPALFRWREPVA